MQTTTTTTTSNESSDSLPLDETYQIAHQFYKEKFGKAVHLSYDDNLRLIALSQQAHYGPLDEKTVKPLGMFDVVGKARRQAWKDLNDMPKHQAMRTFVNTLYELCPLFKPYIEAVCKGRFQKSKEIHDILDDKLRLENKNEEEMEKYNEELQLRELQDALNLETYENFRENCENLAPGNPEMQAILLRELQGEHYRQYLLTMQSQIFETDSSTIENRTTGVDTAPDASETDSDAEDDGASGLAPSNMWTRTDIQKFKDEIVESNGGFIRVPHGEIVTVRVPTSKEGVGLFWEFATDTYDIGFGIFFEWGTPETQEVTIKVSDSDSEEDYLDDLENEPVVAGDVEAAAGQEVAAALQRNLSVVVPVYRRNCHLEVYAGSSNYGEGREGTYILKFDNSYSLWRSKALYYRVFYTR